MTDTINSQMERDSNSCYCQISPADRGFKVCNAGVIQSSFKSLFHSVLEERDFSASNEREAE